ncbi:DUF6438 domain-containing protein [Pontibacter cellulosilyticus]|uniref:DUF6438 domain-containing protein n=1 Tax=Pontibacter cellulosilyticus TaxID=1720253 RepID=A0A923N4G9_9BACT|nr:DUF6438 domain-containing protein [Pontibacter cellulosilyticus]MBC5992061.1 hypothetical protein [Pontibacter cellulosilyticus]
MGLSSCASKGVCQASGKSQPALPLLQFQKAPCYGACPAYEANIMQDGSITLISWGNIGIPENDTVQLCLPKQELQQLKTDLAALNYTSLVDAYLTQWTDRPSTYLTFYENGKVAKRVKHQEGGPASLVTFQQQLHEKLLKLVKQKTEQP